MNGQTEQKKEASGKKETSSRTRNVFLYNKQQDQKWRPGIPYLDETISGFQQNLWYRRDSNKDPLFVQLIFPPYFWAY